MDANLSDIVQLGVDLNSKLGEMTQRKTEMSQLIEENAELKYDKTLFRASKDRLNHELDEMNEALTKERREKIAALKKLESREKEIQSLREIVRLLRCGNSDVEPKMTVGEEQRELDTLWREPSSLPFVHPFTLPQPNLSAQEDEPDIVPGSTVQAPATNGALASGGLTLHGLQQHCVKLTGSEKNRKLIRLLDSLEFEQAVIFVESVARAIELDKLLVSCNFPSISVYSGLQQEERIKRYTAFKSFEKRILVATDIFGRGSNAECVINYDCPPDADSYLHRVGHIGRFVTQGLAVTFVSSEDDEECMKQIMSKIEVAVSKQREHIYPARYMTT